MPKTIGWETAEVIGIGLPHLYRCTVCNRLVHCLLPPEPKVCHECLGIPPGYEKIAHERRP